MKRYIALLLSLVLFLWGVMPVRAQAAQTEDPWVLLVKKDDSGAHHYLYDTEGRILSEEIIFSSGRTQITYEYGVNGNLNYWCKVSKGQLVEEVYYDDFGNEIEHWDHTGTVTVIKSDPEYDDYGRLIGNTITGCYDAKGKLTDYYEVEQLRYEYYDDPVTLEFGHYEQDGNTANGPEPIEWEILDTDGEKMLLISKYALDSRAYHGEDTAITWEKSDLREWLNGEFLEKAFSYSEYNQLWEIRDAKGFWDKVFLLSEKEAERYFPHEEGRICTATKYAKKQGAYVNKATGGSWWYLRHDGKASDCVSTVNSDGAMDYNNTKVTTRKGAVRPAMWVCVTAMAGNATADRVHSRKESYDKTSKDPIAVETRLSTYTAEGMMTHCRIELEESWGVEVTKELFYDDHGNLTYSMIRSVYGGVDENLEEYTFKNSYDKAGRMTKQIEFWNGQQEYVRTYRYDSAGRLISRTTSSGLTQDKEIWTYDRYGNLLTYSCNGKVKEENTYGRLSEVSVSVD